MLNDAALLAIFEAAVKQLQGSSYRGFTRISADFEEPVARGDITQNGIFF
jgi:hypothetical protein